MSTPVTITVDELLNQYRASGRDTLQDRETLLHNVRNAVQSALGPRAWAELIHGRDGAVRASYGLPTTNPRRGTAKRTMPTLPWR